MGRLPSTILAGLVLLCAWPVFADTLQFTGVDPTGSRLDGIGTGLYDGFYDGKAINFVCDDIANFIRPGDTWMANAWDQSQVVMPGNGLFAGPPYMTATGAGMGLSVTQSYDAVTWLANILFTHGSKDVNGIQYAIWALMATPGAAGVKDPGTGASWIAQAIAHDTYTNPSIFFYTPDGNKITAGPDMGKAPQELLGEVPEASTGALLLVGLSLVCLALVRSHTRERNAV